MGKSRKEQIEYYRDRILYILTKNGSSQIMEGIDESMKTATMVQWRNLYYYYYKKYPHSNPIIGDIAKIAQRAALISIIGSKEFRYELNRLAVMSALKFLKNHRKPKPEV